MHFPFLGSRWLPHMASALCLVAMTTGARASEALVAVAANFAEPVKAVAAVLEKTTGHTMKITLGATGKLYAQIKNGAPFDMFLAADTKTPEKLEAEGQAVRGSRFTYANGKLVLWSANAHLVDATGSILKDATLRKVALANPKLAPYGAAAIQVMENLNLSSTLAPKLVQGESIGQAFGFAQTGNADIGFVAMSQVLEGGRLKTGSMWVIPQTLYAPIRQDAVILSHGANNAAAQALANLLKSPNIKDLIRSYGYDI